MYLSSRSRCLGQLATRRYTTGATSNGLLPHIRAKAEQLSKDWKGTSTTGGTTKNFIGGEFVESKATEWLDVVDPVSQLSTPSTHTSVGAHLPPRPLRLCCRAFLKLQRLNSRKQSTQLPRRSSPGAELVS